MNNNQEFIKQKIKEFVRKYYLNKLFRGAILFVFITLLVFIIYSLLEYFSYFSTTVRSVLFYSYIGLFLLTFIFYILIPVAKILGLGKQLTKEQIAGIIGRHFPEIDDKLLNIFQLETMAEEGDYKSYELISTAIDTKIDDIKPFKFTRAIPFSKTAKYLKWGLIPVFLFILIFIIKNEVFTESPKRIVNHDVVYEKPAPYQFEIQNDHLQTFQNEEYTVNINVKGDELPSTVYIAYGNKNFQLSKIGKSEFSYTFKNLQSDTKFSVYTEEVSSPEFELKVLPKPIILSFSMTLHYPPYLNKNDEVLDNNGDATVPDGTTVTWAFYTRNTDNLSFILPTKTNEITAEKDIYKVSYVARTSFQYAIVNRNKYCASRDTLKHALNVIPDQYPEIVVESQADSVLPDRIYFKGNIKDDYGFSKARFVYSKYDDENHALETAKTVDIPINHQQNVQDFYYYFDAGILQLDPGYRVDYYFEVFDNDGVNGAKSSRTSAQTFRVRTQKEIDEELKSSSELAKSEMEDLIQESAQLMKDISKLQEQLLQDKEMSWQDKKKLENLLEKYEELKKQIDELKKNQEQQNMLEDQFKETSENILKKQQELQRRMDEVLSDEIKDMLQKLQQMMNDATKKDDVQKAMKEMKNSTQDLNKALDQQLELYKQLEFEKKYTDIIEKTKKLSEEQKALSKQSEQKNINKNELLQKQESIENKYNELKKDLQDLQKLNKELEDPNKLVNTEQLQKQIEQDMRDSKDALNKNNRGKASESQQDAGEKMEEMADQMEMNMLENEEENLSEDIETLRQILDNLVQISFNQESNMQFMSKLTPGSSRLTDVQRAQHTLKDNMQMISDSLSSLARRQSAVKPFIQTEITKIDNYMSSAITNVSERREKKALSDQQFAMTSINNLSLMLAESMKEMEQQRNECKNCKNKKSGNGSCNKPGGKGKAKTARELQQQLNRQMEALKRSMEQGQQQGQKPGGQSISEQLARMAAQQEAIRKMMQDYQNELKSQNGVGDKAIDQMLKEMEQTEKDLVNRIINAQTINRQKRIETRMLESERAQQQREQEEKRESTEGREIRNPNPPKEWNLDRRTQQQTEMLQSVPPNLNYYYKEKVNQYFYNIEE